MWLKIILTLFVLFFIMTLIVKRFAYFRPTYEFLAPKDTFEDIREGNLHAWYKKGESGQVILFCHGNAGNISHRQDKIIEFLKMGHSVLIFDYSGYGQSRGVPNEQLCYANGDTFFAFLQRRGYKSIVPYGESLGASVASYLARKYNTDKVVLESALPSISALISNWYPSLKFLSAFFPEFNTVSYLSGYNGKILCLHSVNDEIIPVGTLQPIQSMKNATFVSMEGTHNDPAIPWGKIQEFIN